MNELAERIKQLAQEYSAIRKEKLATFGTAPTDNKAKARGLMKDIFSLVAELQQLQKKSK